MKKNFKLMLVALMALFGYSNATAQELHNGATVLDDYYKYTLNAEPVAVEGKTKEYNATATLTARQAGITKDDLTKSDGSIYLVGHFDTKYGAETYHIKVTRINAYPGPLQNIDEATKVTIPSEIVEIPSLCFNGCSAMKTIEFETGSQVTKIGSHAFATTKIETFNFEPCEELSELSDEVFVEEYPKNTNAYIKTVKLPKSPLFKHINGAFKNLTSLTTIENLKDSWIQEVIAGAFENCKELKSIELPGNNLQYIDGKALEKSAIETLIIDLSSIVSLGGGTVNTTTYEFTAAAQATNLYGDDAIDKSPLKSLTLKTTTGKGSGSLTGVIAKNAFSWCDQLTGTLDLSGVTFGSTATIEGEAFATCYDAAATPSPTGIEGVIVGDITDNQSGDYTIKKEAFKGCELLATVVIGDITTTKAIGEKAFGDKLKSVTIGKIKADGVAIAKSAFVYADVDNAELNLAQGSGKFLNANNITTGSEIIAQDAFDMSAITKTGDKAPVIKIGEIKSLGGVFATGAIKPSTAIKELTFTGAIAANGIDKQIFDATAYEGLTAITFKGSIGAAGIATSAFINCTKIQELTFDGLLAEKAVASGAFKIAKETGITKKLNYTVTSVPDYTVNPFDKNAFDASADKDTERFIEFTVTFDKLKNKYEDAAKGLTTGEQFDIFLVKWHEAGTDPDEVGFWCFQNGTTKIAWGRYDLGTYYVETKVKNHDGYPLAVTNGMKIARYQEVQDKAATVKITMYGVYTDKNEMGGDDMKGESLVYMVPLQVFDGFYEIPNTNTCPIIIKVEAISGAYSDKDVLIPYTDVALTHNSVWASLPTFWSARSFKKNMSGSVITTQILWDRSNPTLYDVWGGVDPDHTKTYAPYSIYSISNPQNYKGVEVVKLNVSKESGKIGENWWYTFLPNYGKFAAAARVIWMGDDDATAIFGVKENAKAAVEDGVMYNLQGVRISAPVKGQLYIMNGKKYIGK